MKSIPGGQFVQRLFRVSVFLILWMLLGLVVPSVLFFANVTVGGWMLPVSAAAAGFICARWFRGEEGAGWKDIALCIVIVAAAVFLSRLFYNIHWDGNTYHKTAVGLLLDGWNPLTPDCTAAADTVKLTEGLRYNARWIDHYANGGWILSAVTASFFGGIEAGKAVSLLAAVAVTGVLLRYLSIRLRHRGFLALVTVLAVLTPVTVSQMESFYIDGNLYLYLLLSVLAMLMLSDRRCAIKRRYSLLFLFSGIVYCVNIKFTGMVYIGIFCIGFYVCWLVAAFRKGEFFPVFRKATLLFAGMAAFAVFVTGYSSYVCNYLETGSPLYPLAGGEGTVDIMAYSEPNTFSGKSNPEKSLISLFGKTENVTNTSKNAPALKVPFTVSLSEVKACMYTDTRVGGLGPWFSGIFLVSAGICVWGLKAAFAGEKLLAAEWSVTLALSALMYLFLPGSWWARYSAYLYFFVTTAMFFLAVKMEEAGTQRRRAAGTVLFFAAITANVCCFLLSPAAGAYRSVQIRQDLQKMRAASEEGTLTVWCPTAQMTGIFWNLDEWGIDYVVTEEKTEGEKAYGGKLVWSREPGGKSL